MDRVFSRLLLIILCIIAGLILLFILKIIMSKIETYLDVIFDFSSSIWFFVSTTLCVLWALCASSDQLASACSSFVFMAKHRTFCIVGAVVALIVAIITLLLYIGDCQKHSKVLYVFAFHLYGLVSTIQLVTILSLLFPGFVDAATSTTSSGSNSVPESEKIPDIHRYDTVEDLSTREQYTVINLRGDIIEIKKNGGYVVLRRSGYSGEYFDDYGHRYHKV